MAELNKATDMVNEAIETLNRTETDVKEKGIVKIATVAEVTAHLEKMLVTTTQMLIEATESSTALLTKERERVSELTKRVGALTDEINTKLTQVTCSEKACLKYRSNLYKPHASDEMLAACNKCHRHMYVPIASFCVETFYVVPVDPCDNVAHDYELPKYLLDKRGIILCKKCNQYFHASIEHVAQKLQLPDEQRFYSIFLESLEASRGHA
jgi:hypothetical protein